MSRKVRRLTRFPGLVLPGLLCSIALAGPPERAPEAPLGLVVSQLPVQRPVGAPATGAHSFRHWYPSASRLVRVDLSPDEPPRVTPLVAEFTAARDPDLDPAGESIVFCGREDEGSPWQIWRMSATGTGVRRLVDLPFDCFGPRHLPNGRVIFFGVSDHHEEAGPDLATTLYVIDPDDRSLQRVTFQPSSDFKPLVLPDGRIVYGSWKHHGTYHGLDGEFALATIQWDGCGPWTFDDVHPGAGVRVPSGVTDDGALLCVRFPSLTSLDGTDVVGFVAGDSYAGETVMAAAGLGHYRSAVPAGESTILSFRPTGSATFGIYRLAGGEARPARLFDDARYDETDIAVIRRRPRPLVRFTGTKPNETSGLLFCQDIYRSSIHDLPRGIVDRVRIIEGIPTAAGEEADVRFLPTGIPLDVPGATSSSAAGFIQKRVLGEVAPARDGSFKVRVPADRPLHLQLLDHRGVALVTQASWFWVRPGENRGCVGCHEDRETSVRNRVILAAEAEAVDLTREETAHTIDFRRDIAPTLARSCAVEYCHSEPEPTADFNMLSDGSLLYHESIVRGDETIPVRDAFFDRVYETFLRPKEGKPPVIGGALVHAGVARDSPLVWMIFGKRLGESFEPAPFTRPIGPSHPGDDVPEDDLRRIAEWVDLGAHWDNIPGPDRWTVRTGEPTAFDGNAGRRHDDSDRSDEQ